MAEHGSEESRFWLNAVLDEVEAKYPDGEIVISSGISPSASYHIGHFREILSADLIHWGLKRRGRAAKHYHVVDNFDPLRKRYDFLPEEYEKYVGWPVCLVPDPDGCHDSYAEHYFQEFNKWVQELKVECEVIRSYEDLYSTGRMAGGIEKALESIETIKSIFKEVSNRDLADDWAPIQILSDSKSFSEWRYAGLDKDSKQINYRDESGNEGRVSYADGRVKLNWRLDWPARWAELGVMVEPHGFQEHGASGGSYETGLRFAKEVFGIEGPIAGFQYGHVHLPGDKFKMSSSKGNLVTPDEAFRIMPPEMLRYFYARYPGKKRIDFDPGLGLFRMYDEFAAADLAKREGQDYEFSDAHEYGVAGLDTPGVSKVPFSHLVTIYQSSDGDYDEIVAALERTGYDGVRDDALKRQLEYVKNWLDERAPDEVKFELKKELPKAELSDQQKAFLGDLAEAVTEQDNPDGEWYHHAIHEQREKHGLEPKPAFEAVYRVLLGQDSGPKAGWYLSLLDKDWLAGRFKEASST